VNPNPNIFSQIRTEKRDFLDNSIVIVPGYSFNQYQTIKRINLYLNSKFEDSTTYLNRDKLFFNVTTPACEVATKMLNVDTKDIRLLPMNPKTSFATYLLEKELKQWLKTSKMANILNQIAEATPKFGSSVLEKVKGGAEMVDLRRLFVDPTVERIKDSRFITTVHYLTPTQLRETGWDNVDVAIERFGTTYGETAYEDQSGGVNMLRSTPYIKVYKRYGEVPKWWVDGGKSEEMVKALFIVAGADEQEKNAEGKVVGEYGVVLFKSRWYKEWPFKDFHYNKIMGRWLGLGIAEALFDTQVRMNEIKNQKRISMEISAQHWFQTKDKQIVRNLLTDKENGDILISPSGIEPIVNEERNLSAFESEEQSYFQQSQRLSFAYDAVSGEASAASTTATAVINAQQQATSTFGFKRENYTNMLRDFFNDLVMPEAIKDLTPEHIMRFTGSSQELTKLDDAAAELYANDEIKKMALSGKMVTAEMQEAFRQKAKDFYKKLGENRFLKIKEAFYKDAEFDFDFNIGNEQVNPQTIAANTQAMMAQYNPEAMQDPMFKLLFFKNAESLGISPGEIELAVQESAQQEQKMMQMEQMQAMQPQLATNQPTV
jgi:hypothetical protein